MGIVFCLNEKQKEGRQRASKGHLKGGRGVRGRAPSCGENRHCSVAAELWERWEAKASTAPSVGLTCPGSLGFDDRFSPSPTRACFMASAGMRFMIVLGFPVAGRRLPRNSSSSRVPISNRGSSGACVVGGASPWICCDPYSGNTTTVSIRVIVLASRGVAPPWGRHQAKFVHFCKPAATRSAEQTISKILLNGHSGSFSAPKFLLR